ncbi:MAG: hypothetical protein ACRDKV_08695, partial [Solirubrobacterales bacterium]
LGPDVSVQATLVALNERLGHWVEAKERNVLEAFRRRDALRGMSIAWDDEEGTAEGIDDAGNLLVSTGSGERVSLGAGEVHLKLDKDAA